ncbi:MAG: histidinol-phosphate aminotransferase [Acidimicrobiaceae bacterium]|nr:histidinol-phosphate aminotransferase [Acidimicrobiaceae bacterium]
MTLPDPVDNLGQLEGYHSPQVPVAVRLNTNESPYPPPPAFVAALADALAAAAFHRYPDRGYRDLRVALARLHGVAPEQVFCANGSNEVLQTLFLTYGGPGRSAAVFEPTYAMHSQIGLVTGTAMAVGQRSDDFTLSMDEVSRVIAAALPALTFVCSPNNPTGRIEPKDLVHDVLAAAPGLTVVDEAYGQFASWSALSVVADDVPLVVTRTYSKTWSMAGMRLGYLVGPAEVVAELDKRVLPYHLDVVKQAAGTLALAFTDDMESRVAALVSERERLAAALGDLPVGLLGEQRKVRSGVASPRTRLISSMERVKSSARCPTAMVVPVTSPIWECMA